MERRKVTVHNTVGANNTSFMSSASTWGELSSEFDAKGIRYSGMKVVQGENQVTLESNQAELKEGDITIFLVAQKVKSGSNEAYLISWEDGITWEEYDTEDVVEENEYKTVKDLVIAKAKKAQAYIQDMIEFLVKEGGKSPQSPEVASLERTGREIMQNLGLLD